MADSPGIALGTRNATKLATLISNVVQPSLVMYATLFALLVPASTGIAQLLLHYFVLATCMTTLPIIAVLYLLKSGRITHAFIPLRHQRTGIYAFTVAACVLAYLLARLLAIPGMSGAFVLVTATNTLAMLVINLFWKISGHAAGLASPLVALTFSFGWSVVPLYLLVPLVGWSRVVLQAHTPAQVIAGTLLGLLLTWVQLAWLLPLSGL